MITRRVQPLRKPGRDSHGKKRTSPPLHTTGGESSGKKTGIPLGKGDYQLILERNHIFSIISETKIC